MENELYLSILTDAKSERKVFTKRTRFTVKVWQEDVPLRAGNDENVSVGCVVAEGLVGHARDVGVVADDVADRPGADRRQLRVAEPQLAVYVGVREEVPERGYRLQVLF